MWGTPISKLTCVRLLSLTCVWLSSLVVQMVKHLPAMRETWVQSLDWKIPWRRKWQPTPVLLPGKSHGWRSLVGYSRWGQKELDMTEWVHFLSFYTSFRRRKWQSAPVCLPGESHGQRGLVGYRLWRCKELDTTKQLTHTHTHTHTCPFALYLKLN